MQTTPWAEQKPEFKSAFGLPAVAMPCTTSKLNGTHYDGRELGPTTTRPGAMDAYKLPSRMGGELVYRKGGAA